MDSIAKAKDFFHSFFEGGWEDPNNNILTDTAIIETAFGKGVGRSITADANKQWLQAFPDLCGKADFIMEGDLVIADYRGWGTNNGSFMNNTATDRQMSCSGMMIFEFDGDKISSYKNTTDILSICTQLAIKPPEILLSTTAARMQRDHDVLLRHICNFLASKTHLSMQETEVLSFWVNGHSEKEIGNFFTLSYPAIQMHLSNIMLKLDCNSKRSLLNAVADTKIVHLFRDFYELCIKKTSKFFCTHINPQP